ADPAVRVLGESEHRPGDMEVVDRHREAALGLATTPRRRDAVELVLERRTDLLGRDDAEGVPRFAEPRDRLAHLADRTPLERERLRPQHRLLPDRDGLESQAAVTIEVLFGRADYREPPPVRANDAPQLREEPVDLGLVADWIAADENRPSHDAVGEKGTTGRREEIAL